MTRIEIAVKGMKCSGCEGAVQLSLDELEGVREAKADHRAGRVRVSFDPARVDAQRLRAQIERAGYRPVAERVG